MPKRPETFRDVIGHSNIVEYLTSHLKNGTLPQFIILEGDEGLGKSTLAKLIAMGIVCPNHEHPCYDCPTCREVRDRVIQKNQETESIKLYNMSIEGGKDAAKEVESNLTLGLSNISKKVIIMDEAHGMSDAAQDVFLVSTEYLPKGVYIIMCTTDAINLKATLKSRAVTIHLNHLKKSEILQLLKTQIEEQNLTVQGGETTLNLIAGWANGKPRVAMNLIQGFGQNNSVSSAMVKEFIDYMDVDDILPLLAGLGGSMTDGLAFISEMKINASIVDMLIEILKIKKGRASYALSLDDARKIRTTCANVSEESLVKFIYEVAAQPKLTRQALIAAFIKSHHAFNELFESNKKEVLEQEMAQRAAEAPIDVPKIQQSAPSMVELLRKGTVVGE